MLSCLIAARVLPGQAPPPDTGVEAAAQKPGATPAPKWTEELTVGAQLDAGRAGTKAVNITGDVMKKYETGVLRFDVSESYGSIEVSGMRFTSLNRQYGSISWTHDITPVFHIIQINSIERDTIRLIDYRASNLNVFGIRLKKRHNLSFDFGPGFAILYQEKNTPQVDGLKFDAGGFYSLVYTIDPRWQITHWATCRDNVTYTSDLLLDATVALTGMINKWIGVKLSVAYNYEGVLSQGNLRLGFNTRNYLTTTVGLNLHH